MAKKTPARGKAKPAQKGGRAATRPRPSARGPSAPTTQPIDHAEVRRIASLARLDLGDDELPALAQDLAAILSYVDKLKELDTSDVEPTTHAVELATRLRDDVVGPGLPVELGLANAPERIGDGFGVPKIIE